MTFYSNLKSDLYKIFHSPLWIIHIAICKMVETALTRVCILCAVITALHFSRRLKENLVPINTATEKIEAKDLDFEILPTKIKEFNSSLTAIGKLKEALAISLTKQWDDEQHKKFQLSAIAHDIKTPLTIIKGNAELLLEEEYDEADKELILYIQTSTNTIETYLDLLMGVVINEPLPFCRETIHLDNFINNVVADALPLCNIKNIRLNVQNNTACDSISIDKNLLKRAIINIIDNAVRYSNQNERIDLLISESETQIQFEIMDYGKGFSEESLKKATQEFFTEDTSRTHHNYGLGLNFVEKIVELHQGTLNLENRRDVKGAKVSFTIPKDFSK